MQDKTKTNSAIRKPDETENKDNPIGKLLPVHFCQVN